MDKMPATLQEAIVHYGDPANCERFMIALRWPDGKVKCPHCGSENVSYLPNARLFKCYEKHEKQKFSLKVGTIFEDSALGLDKWLPVMWMLVNCKNGVSSWEIHRALGVTQKTAWFMLQRARLATQGKNGGKLDGQIEVDETFIGGLSRNMHKGERAKRIAARGPFGKAVVMAVLERHGEVRPKVVPNTSREELTVHIKENGISELTCSPTHTPRTRAWMTATHIR
jgi:transposase-like protein